jgi:hypothetical protein
VTGGWIKLLNEELRSLYSTPNIIRVTKSRSIRWAEQVAKMRVMRNGYILVGNPEGKRPLGRHGRRWEENIKMDLRKIVLEVVYWIHLAQDRDKWWVLVNTAMNFQVP